MTERVLEHQVSNLVAAIQDDLRNGEKKIYEGIVLSPMINTIQESVFRNYYLPCFAGFVNPDNWIVNWIQVAGSPMSEVSVVDQNNQEVFHVPPLLASSKAILANRAGSLKDIFGRQELLKNSLTGNHTEYVFDQLGQKSQEIDHNASKDATDRWNVIFAAYGITFQRQDGNQQNPTSEDDIFSY